MQGETEREKLRGEGLRWSFKKRQRERERERLGRLNENSWREKGVEMLRKKKKCVKESDCSSESSLHVLAGHHSAVRSTFPGQGLLVTLMAWKEDHVTLSPCCNANMAVAFVSSAPSALHDSLKVTN